MGAALCRQQAFSLISDHGSCHPRVELSTLLNILGSEFCAAGPGLPLQFPESTDVRAALIPCGQQRSARKELLCPARRRPPTQAPALCWALIPEPIYSSLLLCEAFYISGIERSGDLHRMHSCNCQDLNPGCRVHTPETRVQEANLIRTEISECNLQLPPRSYPKKGLLISYLVIITTCVYSTLPFHECMPSFLSFFFFRSQCFHMNKTSMWLAWAT